MLEKTIKNFFFLYLIGGLFVFLSLYVGAQFIIFTKEYEKAFLKETNQVADEFKYILKSYKTILEKISYEIRKKDLFHNTKGISDSLYKAYTHGIENNGIKEKIRATGINWVGIESSLPIGYLGQIKSPLKFPSEYMEKLEKNFGALQISALVNPMAPIQSQIINLGIGVRDSEKYKGFLNARIDVGDLIEKIKRLKMEYDHQLIMLDENLHVVGTTIQLSRSEMGRIGALAVRDKPPDGFLNIFSTKNLLFPIILKIKNFPYFILTGYDKHQYYNLFLMKIAFDFSLLFLFSLLVIFLVYFNYKKIMRKTLIIYNEKIKENRHLIESQRRLEDYVQSSEEAEKGNKKFQLEVNRRVSRSFSEMLNIGNFLLKVIEEEESIEESSKKLMIVFESAYTHSRFFCIKNEDISIDVKDILEEVYLLLGKKILKKDIHFIKHIQKNIKNIVSDRLSVKQVIVNILMRSIKNSPREGEIELNLFTHLENHKKNICLECKDNGYVEKSQQQNQNLEEGKKESIDCTFLEWEDLETQVRSLGGTLTADYKPYDGNYFLFCLPYKINKNLANLEKNEVIQKGNVIPFSLLKKE